MSPHSLTILVLDSSTGLDLEVTGGKLTKEMLLSSFSKVSAPRTQNTDIRTEPVTGTEASAVEVEPVAGASSNLQDRVEKAKMMVEQRRQEKEDAEKEKEKTKEMERRELGKAMLEMKKSGGLLPQVPAECDLHIVCSPPHELVPAV